MASPTLYQRVGAVATDYDIAGHPIFLKFDSVDDALSTPTIDFTATDKMTVVAGVRKLSDATAAVFAEISTSSVNAGMFGIYAPTLSMTGNTSFVSIGSIGPILATTVIPAPATFVLSGAASIAGDSVITRIGGIQKASSALDQGTGTYGAYPLFIGARAGTSLFFNGHINQLTIFGKTLTPSQLAVVERYTGRKTGIAL